VLTTDTPLKFGSQSLAPGTYTINLQPGPTWQLIIGNLEKPGQWGVPYNAALEMWRVPMTAGKPTSPVEQVTYTIADTPAGATLHLEWGTTRVSVPFTVGSSRSHFLVDKNRHGSRDIRPNSSASLATGK
jgi:hypothetical protein